MTIIVDQESGPRLSVRFFHSKSKRYQTNLDGLITVVKFAKSSGGAGKYMVDVRVSDPLQVSNSIVFLNARLAMTFISVRFGTAKMVRRTLGVEG